jgi:threonine dehydratase
MAITPQNIYRAYQRIAPYILRTPVEFSTPLKRELGINAYFKLENLQVSGSFKPRGAFNKIIKNPGRDFVAPTAGGHGVGLSYAARELNVNARILMPSNSDADRITDVLANGAALEFLNSVPDAIVAAREIERSDGLVFVSAFDDVEMIEGGGTIGVELLEQIRHIDCLVCGVGGGGYIAGLAILLKAVNPDLTIIGVQQENGRQLAEWHRTKRYPSDIQITPSIAEGIGAAVSEDSITWPYIDRLVDDFLVVSEREIRDSLVWMLRAHKHYVEPSAVVGLAAIRSNPHLFQKFNATCTIITGRNMSYDKFRSILAR